MKQPNAREKTGVLSFSVTTITIVVFVLLLSLPSCAKKNAEADADITIYELQTKNIEHVLVCLDHYFTMIPEQASSKQHQMNTLVGLLNITTAQLLILQDQRETLGEEQRQELTNMSKRLHAVHEDLQARFKAIQGRAVSKP